jgi:hypothetical protein
VEEHGGEEKRGAPGQSFETKSEETLAKLQERDKDIRASIFPVKIMMLAIPAHSRLNTIFRLISMFMNLCPSGSFAFSPSGL